MVRHFFCVFFLLSMHVASGQLGFCTGSKGDPIFFEDFGSGTTFGPALPAGVTNYTFVATVPEDGQYTIYNNVGMNANWHNTPDHTPDSQANGVNGKCLIVNASFTPGEFYRRTVTGLCANTTFEFTAWVINAYNANSTVCGGGGIPNNITFEIWDAAETTLLKQGNTGDIPGTTSPLWRQYGLTFTTQPGQTSVLLKMRNNGVGGCGNDLAIDDIMFRSCGEFVSVQSPVGTGNTHTICSNSPVTTQLEASVSGTNPFVLQWQTTTNGTVWSDIPGETGPTYTATVAQLGRYRVKIAQDASNLANSFCYTVSEPYTIQVYAIPNPPFASNPSVIVCGGNYPALNAQAQTGEAIEWFDAPTGGNLLATGNNFTPTAPGTYYAEAFRSGINCRSLSRTAVTLSEFPPIPVQDKSIDICQGASAVLDATLPGVTYQWPDASANPTFTVSSGGIYTVTLTDANGCQATQNFTVTIKVLPEIESVLVDGTTVTVNMQTAGDFEYSLDGIYFQASNVFYNVQPGFGTVYVNETNFCGNDQEDFLVLQIPRYFTPNGDGINDLFEIPGLETMPLTGSEVQIFDRYGQFITALNSVNPNWDGTFNGNLLPSTDYWYRAKFPGYKTITGHFSLKR